MSKMNIKRESLNNVEAESVSNETEETILSNEIDNANLLDEVENVDEKVDSIAIQEKYDEPTFPENNEETISEAGAEYTENVAGAEYTENVAGAEYTENVAGAEYTENVAGAMQNDLIDEELAVIVEQFSIQEALAHNHDENKKPQISMNYVKLPTDYVKNVKSEMYIDDEEHDEIVLQYNIQESLALNNIEHKVPQHNIKNIKSEEDINDEENDENVSLFDIQRILAFNNVENEVSQDDIKNIMPQNDIENATSHNFNDSPVLSNNIKKYLQQNRVQNSVVQNNNLKTVKKNNNQNIVILNNLLNTNSHVAVLEEIVKFIEQENINDIQKENDIVGEVPKEDEEDGEEDLAEHNEINDSMELDEAPKEDGEEDLAELNESDDAIIVDEADDDNDDVLMYKIANEPPPMNNVANEPPPINNVINEPPPINNVANESPPMNNIANEPPAINNVTNVPPVINIVPPHEISNQQEWVIKAREKLLRHAVEWNDYERVNELLLENINYLDAVDDWNRSPLYLAVLHQKPLIAQILIDNGANVNIKESRTEMTPLHVAVKNKDPEMVKLLIYQGANLDEVNKYNATPLHVALESGNEDILLILLKKGANVDVIKYGKSLIILAVEFGYRSIAKLFYDYGCDINFITDSGKTALHVAVELQNIKMIKMLLDLGAKSNIRTVKVSALDIATKQGNSSVVRLLLENMTDPEDRQKIGIPALSVGFQHMKQSVVHTLLMCGINPKRQHREDKSFLHMAIELDWAFTVSLLLDKGIDANSTIYDKITALHIAVDVGNVDVVKMLIKRGANINARISIGATPLYISIQNGCVDIAKMLLEAGADPDIKDDVGLAPLHVAFEIKSRDIACLLIDHKADPNLPKFRKTPLEMAMDCEWIDVMHRLLKNGADVNAITSCNWSILTGAVKRTNVDIIKVLLDYGADIEVKDTKTWMTPLHFATAYSSIDVVACLLERGADLNYTTPCGVTALQIAFNRRDAGLVRLLLEKNASVGTVFGKSPLRMAVEFKWLSITRMLLSRGCDPNECTGTFESILQDAMRREDSYLEKRLRETGASEKFKSRGYSLLHIAAERGLVEMAELLLDYGAQINRQDFDDTSPLHVALKNSNDQLALKLIDRGADLRLIENRLKRTTLHLAVEGECYGTLKVVLKKNVIDIDTYDNKRMTALYLAAAKNNNFLVELLLKYGAKVDICNRTSNCTVLHYALRHKNERMARMLLLVGMPIHCRCSPADTAMGLALHTIKEDWVVKLLLERDLDDRNTVIGRKAVEIFLPHIDLLPKDSSYVTWLLMHLARKSADVQDINYRRYKLPRNLRETYQYFCKEIHRMLKDEKMEQSPYHRILIKDPQMMETLERDPKFLAAVANWDYKALYPSYSSVLDEYFDNIKKAAQAASVEKKRNTSFLATWCNTS